MYANNVQDISYLSVDLWKLESSTNAHQKHPMQLQVLELIFGLTFLIENKHEIIFRNQSSFHYF